MRNKKIITITATVFSLIGLIIMFGVEPPHGQIVALPFFGVGVGLSLSNIIREDDN